LGTVIDEAAARAPFEDKVARRSRARPHGSCYGNIRAGALYSPHGGSIVWTRRMPLVKQETFGPVSPVMRLPDD